MKIYKTQAEVDADLEDNKLIVKDNVTFLCDVVIAGNIDAFDINAHNIVACDINAQDIIAGNIDAHDIKYYCFCISHGNILCNSHHGLMDNHLQPQAINGKITIREE